MQHKILSKNASIYKFPSFVVSQQYLLSVSACISNGRPEILQLTFVFVKNSYLIEN